MQRHTTAADGQEHEMSVASYPTWSASTSHQQPADPPAEVKYHHYWPAQAYHCTFCSRVFRTAQALGGHMNIHRRERAYANDAGAHFYARRGDSQASNSILSRSSMHPVATLDQLRGPLFGSTPPTPFPPSFKENCYANRRIAVTPDSAAHPVTTANFFAPIQAAGDMTYHHHHRVGWNGGDRSATHPVTTANFFAPIQVAGDMTYHHRVGWNGGDAARSEESSGHNASDPLSWLFSQLPPPNSVSTLQRQQPQQNQQQQQGRGGHVVMQPPQQQQARGGHIVMHPQQKQHQQCRGGNVLMQQNLARPYQRAVAAGLRGGHPAPLPTFPQQSLQGRGRLQVGGSCNGQNEDGNAEGLDLELRL